MEEKLLEFENPEPNELLQLVAREVPFVVRGLCRDWPALTKWDFPYLSKRLQTAWGKVYKAYFRSREGELHEDIPTKELVRAAIHHADNFPIVENMAIWLSAASNLTTMHYDGYSYDGLNVQVTGYKTFELCHPNLECMMAPFLQGAVPRPADAEARRRVTSYRVEMTPGDCLYTPRFWFHTVTAHTDATNVQYHFARKTPPSVETRAMQHYINNAWIVANMPWLIPRMMRKGIAEYPEIIALYAAMARPREALAQVAEAALTMAHLVVVQPRLTLQIKRQYSRKTLDDLPKLV